MNTANRARNTDLEGLEARLGLRVAAMLGEQLPRTAPDISERLRVGRELALERARQARRQVQVTATATAGGHVVVGRGSSATLADRPAWWVKLGSALPLALLVAGFIAIDRLHEQAQIHAAAEVDAALLSDDVPPAAYTDPGFAEYLKTGRH
jgi:hypothetical protein